MAVWIGIAITISWATMAVADAGSVGGAEDQTLDGLSLDPDSAEGVETATFAMGCFWGVEARFGLLPGVIRTRVGYAGGTTEAPTYRQIGDHAEAVQIDFDPRVISYDELLQQFFSVRSPIALRQLVGEGQYRFLILFHDEAQQTAARTVFLEQVGAHGDNWFDQLVQPLGAFTPAEAYHQKYFLQSEEQLFAELLGRYRSLDELLGSTVAARINGYVAGRGTRQQLEEEIDHFGLSDEEEALLRQIVDRSMQTTIDPAG